MNTVNFLSTDCPSFASMVDFKEGRSCSKVGVPEAAPGRKVNIGLLYSIVILKVYLIFPAFFNDVIIVVNNRTVRPILWRFD